MALEISTTEIDGKCLITVNGEIDLYSSPELRAAVTQAVPKAQDAVGIDLSGVAYMDSSGVATLVEGLRAASQSDRSFVLVAPSSPVMKVLQLSRLDSVFEIRDSL
jgi:anti-sigma B factor antagonist